LVRRVDRGFGRAAIVAIAAATVAGRLATGIKYGAGDPEFEK
jgi:hypothetical protein